MTMKNLCRYPIILLGCAGLCACGFKSDLFMPGDSQRVGQMQSSSIKIEKELPTLDSLDNRDTEIFKTTDRQTAIPDEGVPVMIEPLTDEEMKKNKRKK